MLNIPFSDGNMLENIQDDKTYRPGYCPTCDFGAIYINEFCVTTTNYIIKFYSKCEFDYLLSEGALLKMFLNIDTRRITEEEFLQLFKKCLIDYVGGYKKWEELLEHKTITYEERRR